MNRCRLVACAVLGVSFLASSLHAQERHQTGLTMGYPTAVGVIWHATDRVALRPEISFSSSTSDPTSIQVPGTAGSLSLGTSGSSSTAVGVGISGLFYLWKWDALRAYVAPRVTYSRVTGSSERTSLSVSLPSLTPITTTTTTETTISTWSGTGLFGAQYSLHKRFSAFGEVGLGYNSTRSSAETTPPPTFDISLTPSTHGWSTRSSAGVIFYF